MLIMKYNLETKPSWKHKSGGKRKNNNVTKKQLRNIFILVMLSKYRRNNFPFDKYYRKTGS